MLLSRSWALPHREKSEIHKEIEALEEQWRLATVTNNIGEMNRLLADDYVGITSNGTVENKQQAAGAAERGNGPHYPAGDDRHARARVMGIPRS